MPNSMESHYSKRKSSPVIVGGDTGNCRFKGLDGVDKRWKHSVGCDLAMNTMGDVEDPLSDTGSSGSLGRTGLFEANGSLVRLEEGDADCNNVKRIFFSGLRSMVGQIKIVGVFKNSFSTLLGKARLESFKVFSEAMKRKCADNVNIKYSWFGASSEGIDRIIRYGFAQCPIPEKGSAFGHGLYLSPQNSSLGAIQSSIVDEDGLMHVLLCRVILGKLEVVPLGSTQLHPSSNDFDSGVDNLQHPKKYIVWSTNMNSHVLPEFIISFKAPSLNGIQEPWARPKSPWMPFPALISILNESLPPSVLVEIEKVHSDYRAKKITRDHLVRHLRLLAGDRLLMSILKSCRAKEALNGTTSPASNTKII